MKLAQILNKKLDEITKTLQELAPSSFGKSEFETSTFLTWLCNDFLTEERRVLSRSKVILSKNYILQMAEVAMQRDSQLKDVCLQIQDYCQLIANDNNMLRPVVPANFELPMPLLLKEIENELLAIGYCADFSISRNELEDPRYLFPDQYLHFIFIPQQNMRLEKGDYADVSHSVWTMRCELVGIPKAKRLLHLLNLYSNAISKLGYIAAESDLNFAEVKKNLWLIEVGATVVQSVFDNIYKKLQRKLRVPGHKFGQVPISVLREKFEVSILQQALNQIIEKRFRGGFLENLLNSEVLCTIAPIQEGKELTFFVLGSDDLNSVAIKYPEFQIFQVELILSTPG